MSDDRRKKKKKTEGGSYCEVPGEILRITDFWIGGNLNVMEGDTEKDKKLGDY